MENLIKEIENHIKSIQCDLDEIYKTFIVKHEHCQHGWAVVAIDDIISNLDEIKRSINSIHRSLIELKVKAETLKNRKQVMK